MKKAIFLVLIGISFISYISSGVYAGDSVAKSSTIVASTADEVRAARAAKIRQRTDESATTTTKKGNDGAACSSNDECKGVCEGGSCCTNYGDPCDASSHCCGHQSCTDGKCPE